MLVLDPVDAKVRVILVFTVPVRLNQGVPVLHGLFRKKANRNARAHARELLMVRKHECCSQEQNAEPRVRGVPLGRGEAVGKCRGHDRGGHGERQELSSQRRGRQATGQ